MPFALCSHRVVESHDVDVPCDLEKPSDSKMFRQIRCVMRLKSCDGFTVAVSHRRELGVRISKRAIGVLWSTVMALLTVMAAPAAAHSTYGTYRNNIG